MKKNDSKSIIKIYLVVFLVVSIIKIAFEFFKSGNHLVYNAKTNDIIGWGLLIFFFFIIIWSITQIIKIYKSQKSKIKLLRFIVAAALCLSFMLSIFQFKLYIHKPDSYLIESKITDYYINNRLVQIDNLIAEFKGEIETLRSLKNDIPDSLLKTIFIERQTIKDNSNFKHTGYLYQKDSLKICFTKYDSGQPQAPSLPPKKGQIPHESFKLGSINIIKSSDDIEIIINKSNSDYFGLIESSIDSVKLLYLNKVIDVYKYKKRCHFLFNKKQKTDS